MLSGHPRGFNDKDYKGGIVDTANVLFVEKDGKSLLLGEDAVKLAEILKKEVKRPVKHGLITSEDKTSLSLIKLLVEKIIPLPRRRRRNPVLFFPFEPN